MAVKTRKQKEQRKRKLQDARKRAEEHDSGYSPTAFKLPEGYSLLRWKDEANYDLDVIGYEAGEHNPNAGEGYLAYELTFWVHPNIGPKNSSYCCLAENWGERCHVCEHREKLKKQANANPKHIKEFYPKERQLMIVRWNDPKESKKKYIYEGPFAFGLGQLIDDKIKLAPPKLKDKWSQFHDPEEGLSLNVGVKKTSFTNADSGYSGTFMKPVTLDFVEREESIEDLIENAPNLEECLIKLEPNELKKLFEQTGDSERDEEEEDRDPAPDDDDQDQDDDDQDDDDEPVNRNGKPKKGSKKKEKTAEELGIKKESVVHHDEYGECEVIKVSKDGTSLTLEDEDGEEHMGVDPNECTLVDEDEPEEEEEETPKKKGGKKPAKPADDDEEEEEDDSELEPDEEEEESEEEDSDDDDEQLEPEDDDDDDEETEEEEDDDEDDAPAPKKPAKKQPAKKGGKKR